MPGYVKLAEKGELKNRVEELYDRLNPCHLCPHECMADRGNRADGICGAGESLTVSSAFPHFGEEPPITGFGGSGTVFLTYCNLKCVFCQNYDISHYHRGEILAPKQLAVIMVSLQKRGCHNINFVTPTHFIPQIVEAVMIASSAGLRIPLVYNSSGYDSVDTLQLLEGIFDIYMPDWKFYSPELAGKYTTAEDYPEKVYLAIKEMYRQVGDLELDELGVARKGLLVRHLVLPGMTNDSQKILECISRDISPNTYVNVMDQYRPSHEAHRFPEINRRISPEEFHEVSRIALHLGLARGVDGCL